MARFSEWFNKTRDLKEQRPFAHLIPSFLDALALSEGQKILLPRAVFKSLLRKRDPGLWDWKDLERYPPLVKALGDIWGKLPPFTLFVPVIGPVSTSLALLGRRREPSPDMLEGLIEALRDRVTDALSMSGEERAEVDRWCQEPNPVVIVDRLGQPLKINEEGCKFFEQYRCLDLEELVGTEVLENLSDAMGALNNKGFIEITGLIGTSQGRVYQTNVAVRILNSSATALVFTDLKESYDQPAPRRSRKFTNPTRVLPEIARPPNAKDLDTGETPLPQLSESGESLGYDEQKKDESAQVLCWLCCDPLPPIALGPQAEVTVGRHEGNDLVLPHSAVSRNHVSFKIRGKAVTVYDLGSSNGVYINGQRRTQHAVSVGDQLQIGPYQLLIKDGFAESSGLDDTSEQTQINMVVNAAMAGNLRETPVAELFQSLEFNQKTGMLTITHRGIHAFFAVEEGKPHSARFGRLRDKEAALAMLAFEEGHFTFMNSEPKIKDRTMTGGTITGLLLDASRRKDEESQEAIADIVKEERTKSGASPIDTVKTQEFDEDDVAAIRARAAATSKKGGNEDTDVAEQA